MNLENFAEYLKYPSRLYQLPYEELKSLTLQYPYCGNFHVLLLLKSKLEGHPDLEKNLAKAATYSVDRKFIRQLMQEDQLLRAPSQFTVGEDEVLELKDLFSLEEELEKIPLELHNDSVEENTPSSIYFDIYEDEQLEEEALLPDDFQAEGTISGSDLFPDSPTESFSESAEPVLEELPVIPEDVMDSTIYAMPDAGAEASSFIPASDLTDHLSTMIGIAQNFVIAPAATPAIQPVKSAIFEIPEGVVDTFVAISFALDSWWEQQEQAQTVEWEIPVLQTETPAPIAVAPAMPKIRITPTPKAKFKSYQKGYRQPLVKPETVPATARPKILEPMEARQVARESVREDLEIASETLAGLLVQQEQYDRAIKMYEHLSLLIPEKNTYFAAKIDAIKNL